MVTRTTTRRLERYSISAHSGRYAVDYLELFIFLHRVSREKRRAETGGKVVLIPEMRRSKDYFFFTATEGEVGVAPVIQNTRTADERVGELHEGEAVIKKAHGVVDPENRVLVMEYVRQGAKVKDIKNVIEAAARTDPRWHQN